MTSLHLAKSAHSLAVTLENHFFSSAPALSAFAHSSGWLIRSSGGYTKRGNSASPSTPLRPLDEGSLRQIQRHLPSPPIIRITPLAQEGDDELLRDLGWRLLDPSIVMTQYIARRETPDQGSEISITYSPSASPEWVDGFAASSNLSPSHTITFRDSLKLIHPPFYPSYLTVIDDSTLAAVAYGQAVQCDGIIGLFNIVVPVAHRGRGYGRKVTQALLDWGAEAGAEMAYLQVTEGNAVGRRLYESMGFREAYRYHYRMAP